MDIKNLKSIHAKAMKKLYELQSNDSILEDLDGRKFIVPVTKSKEKITDINGDIYIGKDKLIFNVLIDDLKKINAPLKNYAKITYERESFIVLYSRENGYGTRIHFICESLNGDKNGKK